MSYLSTTPEPPRLAELWPQVAERLDTATMAAILGDMSRTYSASDDYADPEGERTEAWGRVVVVPATTAFDVQEAPDRMRVPPIVVRAEVNDPGKGYSPHITLEAAQHEVFRRLEGWRPAPTPRFGVVFPLFRRRVPEAVALYDPERGLYFNTTGWRMVAGSPAG